MLVMVKSLGVQRLGGRERGREGGEICIWRPGVGHGEVIGSAEVRREGEGEGGGEICIWRPGVGHGEVIGSAEVRREGEGEGGGEQRYGDLVLVMVESLGVQRLGGRERGREGGEICIWRPGVGHGEVIGSAEVRREGEGEGGGEQRYGDLVLVMVKSLGVQRLGGRERGREGGEICIWRPGVGHGEVIGSAEVRREGEGEGGGEQRYGDLVLVMVKSLGVQRLGGRERGREGGEICIWRPGVGHGEVIGSAEVRREGEGEGGGEQRYGDLVLVMVKSLGVQRLGGRERGREGGEICIWRPGVGHGEVIGSAEVRREGEGEGGGEQRYGDLVLVMVKSLGVQRLGGRERGREGGEICIWRPGVGHGEVIGSAEVRREGEGEGGGEQRLVLVMVESLVYGMYM